MNKLTREDWKRRLTYEWNDLQSACDTCKTDIDLIKSLSRKYNDSCEQFLKEVKLK